MATELIVPKLGESISEALISKWLKKVGEPIKADEPVVDLETDKVSVQLPAPANGVLTEQRFAEGTTVKIGDVIGTIAETGATVAATAPAASAPAAPAPAAPTNGAAGKAAAAPAPVQQPAAAP